MSYSRPARTAARRTRSAILAAVVLVGVALVGVAVLPIDIFHDDPGSAVTGSEAGRRAPEDRRPASDHDRRERRDPAMPLGVADGAVPDGTTVFDDDVPAVAKLDPALLGSLRQAATDAAGDAVELLVNSGWRSPEYQEQLLRKAVSKYGSKEEAARWVSTPDTSSHVSGDAVDIGPSDGAAWLFERGAAYGLCQTYSNESWHYELRPEAIDAGCPAMYADPTDDPRMRS